MSSSNTTTHLFYRLLRDYVKPQRKKFIIAILCMIVVAAATAANAWMMKPVLDDIFINKDERMLRIIPFALMGIAIAGSVANYTQTVIMRFIGQRIISDLQLSLFRHLLHSDLALFHDQSAGRLISRFTNDITLMRGVVSNVLTATARQTLTLIFLFGVMFAQNWQLTLIALAVYPLAIFPIVRWGRKMRKLSYKSQDQLGSFSAQLDDVFQGARTVKAYARESYEIERAETVINKLFKLYYRSARMGAAASPLLEILGGIAIAVIIWYGGSQVLTGQTTPGAFSSFIISLIMAYKPAKSMTGLGTQLQEGMAATERLFGVLDTKPTITDVPGAVPLKVLNGSIRFDHVTFHYHEGSAGIEGISLDVPTGKKVALVGHSGGGKSTLMNLLLRFYDVGEGAITIDGQDIRSVTLHSLRESMAFVPQETMLFDDTVKANIAYGKLGASDVEVIRAAEMAAAHEFIMSLPEGYDTMIGPHGVKLSGGQRQRLAIARAILKDAPILLLDEATSALDNESERSVQDAFARLMQGRTTLVIAHRLTTIMNADLIYVIEKGRVVESGNHASLLAQNGTYAGLYAYYQAHPDAQL